ncbi:MAG: zinc-finger domain-containing protein [Sphingomonadales bacterium]
MTPSPPEATLAPPEATLAPPETILVDRPKVSCDGDGPLGHPLVYLRIDDDGRIQCPYCARLFILKTKTETSERA